jgi:kynurenine formamidase
MSFGKKSVAAVSAVALLSVAGVATANNKIKIEGSGGGKAKITCPGGMSRLGHELSEDMSIFPFDPAVEINTVYTVFNDGFQVEAIRMGAHAGTHLDAPAHFIGPTEDFPDDAPGRSVDELAAEEFVWPAYKIDVRGIDFTENAESFTDDGDPIPFVGIDFIEDYEDEHGDIEPGSLVILQTGAEEFWGLGVGDTSGAFVDDAGNLLSDNTDDLFDFENAGFSFDTVQWLFDERGIDAIGADAYGPDAFNDPNFDATYATLLNDGVALVAIANLDTVSVRGDVIMAPTVALADGSGFSTDPLACHAEKQK